MRRGQQTGRDVLEILRPPQPEWRKRLILTEKGYPKAVLANCLLALREAPEWNGVLGFNAFSMTTAFLKAPPWDGEPGDVTDNSDRLTCEWLQRAGIHVSVETAAQAIQTVAREHSFHPPRSYLEGITWDGISRLEGWLQTYLGVADSAYSRAIATRWPVSAVARVFQPGVKADCCLILEGGQGIGKSSALRILGDPWFTDEIADLGNKDASLQVQGTWIVEIAELDSMSRSEVSKIKSFMSRNVDRFRPPYGKRLVESPRQCVFGGTVNHSTYLRDETGGRRFWPVECTSIDLAALRRDRDQLWAEAVSLFRAGTPWWLENQELIREAATEQADRFEGDPWEESIATFIEDRIDVSIDQILGSCLEKPKAQWSQMDKNRIARTLRSLNWERYYARTGTAREWRYRHVAH